MSLSNFVEIGPRDVRQGRYICTEVNVWHCGDEYCDCAQVRAQRWYEHELFRGARWPVLIWQGQYFTDGEGVDERKRELVQALHDIRLRFPLDKFGTITLPVNPENYPADRRDDADLRAMALFDPSDPRTPIPTTEEINRALAELDGWDHQTPLRYQTLPNDGVTRSPQQSQSPSSGPSSPSGSGTG